MDRRILRFRRLFREDVPAAELRELCRRCGGMSFCLVDYFEDEAGTELTGQRLGILLTGNENALVLPSHMTPTRRRICSVQRKADPY